MAMHRINRSEVELHTGDAALARALLDRIGQIYGPRIAPVLDRVCSRVCSERSASETPVRIDRLELDLGTLAADDLEDAFVARLEPALRAALKDALGRRIGGDRSARDSLELLETFALTGSLPWWAPPDREVVAHHLALASAEAEADLVMLLARIAREPGALDRIARLCGRNTMAALLERAQADPRRSADPNPLGKRQGRARDLGDRGPAPSSDVPGVDDVTASPGTDDEPRRRQRTDPTPPDPSRSPAQPGLDGVRAPPRVATRAPRAVPVPTDPAASRAARRGALARLDELYVADAGLVILWPFLERFFRRTGVLGDDHRFFDEAAQLQAVALVDSLATADPAPLEFRLPLAKLLCGRPFESDFMLDRPLAPEQLAEGDRLLAAVIDRAPVPADLSIPSFRAGFLARPGALGTRDGAWLLQVERRPHDAVLDRFPWSWGWIKLPWMPEPLRVEW